MAESARRRDSTHRVMSSYLAGAVLIILCASIARAAPGIDVRPANPDCAAPMRPEPAQLALEEAFPGIPSRGSMTVEFPPGDPQYLYLLRRTGEVYRFLNGVSSSERTEVLDMTSLFGGVDPEGQSGMMDMAFHPDFATNGELYVSYTVPGADRTSYVARYTSSNGGETFSRNGKIILSHEQDGVFHGIGAIFFGIDGYLYIALGDGSRGISAQDPFTFNGTLLRIDVDSGNPYSIPPDNPFVAGGGAPEVYAYGLRNPWRVSQDFVTGDIWAGDVGESDWEEVNRIVAGGNYGWPVMEGSNCRTAGCDTSGLIAPVYEYSHDEGCSVIGGHVYRGSDLPDLIGKYVFTDLCSGNFRAIGPDLSVEDLFVTGFNVRDISESPDGELYVLTGSENRIFEVVPDLDAGTGGENFPTRLSETGCVDPSNPVSVVDGVIPYTVNSALWSDGTAKRRWMALPDGTEAFVAGDGNVEFPIGTVLIKEFSFNGDPFETRLLVRHDDGGWAGYTYEWTDDLTDATLVPTQGLTKQVDGQLDWDYPTRAQCMECHNSATGGSIGPETLQLNGDFTYPPARVSNQLETLDHIGVLAGLEAAPDQLPSLSPLDDESQTVEHRSRSYLHANCAYCHRPDGPGQGPMDFRFSNALQATGTCEVLPENGDLGVPGAHILRPGEPDQSVLSLRMRLLGAGRMPPLGTKLVDTEATTVIDQWIGGLASCEPVDTVPPTRPANVVASGISDSEIELRWDAATDASGIARYTILRDGEALIDTTTTTIIDAGLAPATTYRYQVFAIDNVGISSELSDEVAVATRVDETPPSPPQQLAATAVSDAQIDLSWAASTDNSGIAAYSVFRDGVQIGTAQSTNYTDMNLAPGTNYSYVVVAADLVGNTSQPSAAAAERTLDDATPPSQPDNLAATALSDSRIDLTWTASTDNVGVAAYTVYRDAVPVATVDRPAYSDTGLGADTRYRYTVSATDSRGNESPASAAVEATTQSAPAPSPPTPPPAPPPARSSGGGSIGLPGLLLLVLGAMYQLRSQRRRQS